MTAAIDITPEQRKTLLGFLRRFIPGVEVWAYGSRVKWTSHPGSDLDLVVFTEPEQRHRFSELKDALAESNLPFMVGVHVWAEEPESFQEIIRKEHVVLQSANRLDGNEHSPDTRWPLVPLGELTENLDGRRIPVRESDRKPGPYPYYGASGIVDWVDGYLFDGEYLLIGEDGENLRTRQTPIAFMAKGRFWVNNHAHIVRGNHRADTRFLSYALSQTDIGGYLTGSTMPKLTQGNLNRIPVVAPPLTEQKAIAAVLGALDDKIELNRRMNATLDAMARALFQSWFVDFDPVRAKAEGRPPAGLDEPTAALFPAHFQDSELGEIPQGWRVGTINDLTHFSRTSLTPASFPAEAFDHYSLPAFDDGRVPKVELGGAIKSNKFIIPKDAVLLSKLNPHIPRIWAPSLSEERRAIGSTEFLVASPAKGVTRELIYWLFSSDTFARIYGTLVTGTTGSHQRINAESVLATSVVAAPFPLIQKFTALTKPMLARINHNIAQSRTLAAFRDGLLPTLLSRRISIR